jgi:hypothetical protein
VSKCPGIRFGFSGQKPAPTIPEQRNAHGPRRRREPAESNMILL